MSVLTADNLLVLRQKLVQVVGHVPPPAYLTVRCLMKKIRFDVLACGDCGARALSINNVRVTGPNCKTWLIVNTFFVPAEKIIRHLTSRSSRAAGAEVESKDDGYKELFGVLAKGRNKPPPA